MFLQSNMRNTDKQIEKEPITWTYTSWGEKTQRAPKHYS